jgi:hypothetical protein
MVMCNFEQLKDIFLFIKKYDIPNWFVLLFTGIAWPFVLFLWNRRRVQNISNLEISLTARTINLWREEFYADDTKTRIDDIHPALWLKFSNQTGSTVYLSNARLLKCTKLLNVARTSTRDLSAAYELNFSLGENLDQRQIILQTNSQAETAIALDSNPSTEMLSFNPRLWRRILKCPKYFCLEYVAMVGKKRYNVSTIY